MASAFFRSDRNIWIADFRGYRTEPGGRRQTMTVPVTRIRSADTAEADANAFAEECERYCRIIEDRHEPEDIQHARRLGVISVSQADALQRGSPIPPQSGDVSKRIKIRDAAISHPSSQRDKLSASVRYLKYVDAFVESSGVVNLADLTHDHVVTWANELRRKGWAWDSRRHALLYLRRACAIGPRHGLPDVLAEMPVDRKDAAHRQVIRVWTLERLVQQIEKTEDPNALIALVLGGLCGLRPSEILAADIQHLANGVLETGAKTAASIRSLPLPAYALTHIRRALGKRTTGAMLEPQGPRSGNRYTISGLHQMLADHLKGPPRIGPKVLRKTFATWASRVVEANDLERFLGHASALFLPVTSRHYLATYAAEQLKPAAKLLDAAIRAAAPSPKRRHKAG